MTKASGSPEASKIKALINAIKSVLNYIKAMFSNSEDASSTRWAGFIILFSMIHLAESGANIDYVRIFAVLVVAIFVSKEAIKFMK